MKKVNNLRFEQIMQMIVITIESVSAFDSELEILIKLLNVCILYAFAHRSYIIAKLNQLLRI